MAITINSKNSLFLISEKVIILGMSFLTSVLMARLAGPLVFGQYTYITSFTAIFIPLCAMGLNNIATKYFVKYPKHSHQTFLTALFIRVLGAIACIALGSFSAFMIGVTEEQLALIVTLLILQSFSLFYLIEFFFLARKQVMATLKVRLMVLLLSNIAKIVIILNGADITSLLVVHGMEFVAIGLSYLTLYYQQGYNNKEQLVKPVNKTSVSHLFYQGKWLLLSGIASVLYLKIDQVMLASIHGVEEVAYYAAAAKLSEFWYVFPVLIANAYNAKFILLKKQSAQAYENFILKFLSIMVLAALVIIAFTLMFSSHIIEFIYGNTYKTSATILSIHILATLFIFQRALLSKWLINEGHYKFSMYSHGAGAITNIILNIILIPLYGGIGAAWATLFSYMVASFLSLLLTKDTRVFMMLMSKAIVKWPKYIRN